MRVGEKVGQEAQYVAGRPANQTWSLVRARVGWCPRHQIGALVEQPVEDRTAVPPLPVDWHRIYLLRQIRRTQ